MKLTVLGSGSPKPSVTRANSSYLVEVGGDRVLFDHGFGSAQRMLQAGVAPQSISQVFLTHHHYDHMGDLARLILTRWDQMRDDHNELEVFGPAPLREIIDRFVGPQGAYATDLRARIESACSRDLYEARGGSGERGWPAPAVHELISGDVVTRPQWQVSSATAIHCPGYLECLGYRIDADGHSLFYTGDTGPSDSLTALAEGCDLMIHMCSQTSGEIKTQAIEESSIGHREVAESAARASVKSLLLTHIEHLEQPDQRERVLAEIAEIYSGEVRIAEDLMEIDLGVNKPVRDTAETAR